MKTEEHLRELERQARRNAQQFRTREGEDSPLQGCQTSDPANCCNRQSAHDAIKRRILNLRQQADQLETLLGALPAVLPLAADEALFQMGCAIRNHW